MNTNYKILNRPNCMVLKCRFVHLTVYNQIRKMVIKCHTWLYTTKCSKRHFKAIQLSEGYVPLNSLYTIEPGCSFKKLSLMDSHYWKENLSLYIFCAQNYHGKYAKIHSITSQRNCIQSMGLQIQFSNLFSATFERDRNKLIS